MRTIYLLIVLFLAACVICAEVYIYQVKGGSFFQASAISGALWLVELLLMLLAACFIGLGIGWQLRQERIEVLLDEIHRYENEKHGRIEKTQRAEEETAQVQHKLARAQESFREDFKAQAHEKEKLKEEKSSLQLHLDIAKDESLQLLKRVEQAEREMQLANDNSVLLKNNLEKAQAEIDGLRSKINKSFTLPPKDDLKLIAGIGPALEKKLNALGIYSFRQISEFTPRTIDEVTSAIKFFPGRIERDNWVSQARNFEEEKKRQSS